MTNEWKEVRLEDVAEVLLGKMLDQKKNRGAYLPYLANTNVRWGEFDLTDLRVMRFEAHEGDRYGLKYGDIVMCEGGEPGRCALWRDEKKGMMYQKALHRIRPYAGTDNRFLYYSLLHGGRTGAFSPFCTGTTIKHLPRQNLLRIQLKIPPITEQCAIAQVLGTLDDKIECNRQMNRSLEGIVRALFKSWFIDFDPVIDNALAAGNQIPDEFADRAALRQQVAEESAKPLPDELRALFPAEFICTDSMGPAGAATAGRWIPKGWEVAPLSHIAKLKAKIVNPWNSPDQVWVHFSIPAFDDGRQPVYDKGETIKSGKYLVPPNSVLASKLNPQFPRIWLPDVSDPTVSICSTEFMPFVPKTDFELPFLYAFLSSGAAQTEIANRVTGSTGSRQRVKPKEIAEMPALIPPQLLRQRFSFTIVRHLDRLQNNMCSIAKLSALRDTLLPQLLSGELRVPVAATQAVEVGQ